MKKLNTQVEPRTGIIPDYAVSYTSEEGERIKFQIGDVINYLSRKYKEHTGRGALFQVRGEYSEPIRGDEVYERLLREEARNELEETARDKVSADIFRTTIETLLNSYSGEEELNTTAA
jgi:hypothetical protein